MQATRQTQPHRRDTGRQPSLALGAMLRGSPFFLANPMDVQRRTIAGQPTLAQLLVSARSSTLRR